MQPTNLPASVELVRRSKCGNAGRDAANGRRDNKQNTVLFTLILSQVNRQIWLQQCGWYFSQHGVAQHWLNGCPSELQVAHFRSDRQYRQAIAGTSLSWLLGDCELCPSLFSRGSWSVKDIVWQTVIRRWLHLR